MTRVRWIVVIVLIAVCGLAALPAWAHASLLSASPSVNATLDRAPALVELLFTEPLEPSFSSISVLNEAGVVVDSGDVRVDPAEPTRMTVSLRSLPDGVYTVLWKALSTADGHITTGSYPFAVGTVETEALSTVGQVTRAVRISAIEIAARWLTYLALAVLTGGTLFSLAVWTPVVVQNGSLAPLPNWYGPMVVALIVLAVSLLVAALTQAGQASGEEIAWPWSPVVGVLLSSTRYGALWLARLGLLFALAGLLARTVTASTQRWLALGGCAGLLLTISLGSHAAAESDPWLPVIADWVHLVAASVWVGGLAFFVYSLWTLRSTPAELRRSIVTGLIRRFSALALIAVGVLTLTGVYSAVVQVGEWSALLGTTYGQMLLVKLLIALPMVALGAVNLLVHRPALQQRGNATRVPLFQRTVTGEAALSVALLLSVSILTSIPPAVTNAALPALKGVQTVDDLSVAVEVVPGRIGMNDFTVQINVNGQPLTGAREVEVQFAPESGKLSPNKVPLIPTGDGRYTVRGAYFSLPDRWQMRVAVRREGVFDSYAQFSFDVGVNRTVAIPWGTVCAALLAVAGVIYGLTVYSYTGARRAGFIGMGLMPALGLLAAAGIVFARPPLQETIGPINPVPPTAESVATGRAAYIINCLPCHGPRGKGDGSIGMTLNPRPADLSQHAVPGVHSDAQLYDWITNGYPGSVMPAFKANLSDEQRWHVVNYLREELAKHAVP